jgi:hypothetical protein
MTWTLDSQMAEELWQALASGTVWNAKRLIEGVQPCALDGGWVCLVRLGSGIDLARALMRVQVRALEEFADIQVCMDRHHRVCLLVQAGPSHADSVQALQAAVAPAFALLRLAS